MTIATTTTKSGPYNGTGSQVLFAYDFLILDEDDLEVVLTDAAGVETIQTLTTHYSVSGVGNPAGGNVTMVTPPAGTETLTIRRNMPFTQEKIDLVSQGGFNSTNIEDTFDYVVMHLQQHKEELSRAVTLDVSETSITADQLVANLLAAEVNAAASAAAAAADAVSTAADAVSTNADAIATAADEVNTNADAIATAADEVNTNADAIATAADAIATAADLVETAADVILAGGAAANASDSADSAASSAASAASDEASVAALYDSFDDRYLGSKATDPALDNDGAALLTGAMYWNSTNDELRIYSGSAWAAYAAAASPLPTYGSGDAGKHAEVNAAEDGWELYDSATANNDTSTVGLSPARFQSLAKPIAANRTVTPPFSGAKAGDVVVVTKTTQNAFTLTVAGLGPAGSGSVVIVDQNVTHAFMYVDATDKWEELFSTPGYLKNTWTPGLEDLSANAATLSVAVGRYTKVGRMVHVKGKITCTSLGAMSGTVWITGLPFTSENVTDSDSAGAIGICFGMSVTAGQSVTANVPINSNNLRLYLFDATTGNTVLQAADLTSTFQLTFEATYYV